MKRQIKITPALLLAFLVSVCVLPMTACGGDGAEEVGEEIDDAIDDVEDAID